MPESEMKRKQFHEMVTRYLGEDDETVDKLVQDICKLDKENSFFLREFYNTMVARSLVLTDLVDTNGMPKINILKEISKEVIKTISKEKINYNINTRENNLTEDNDNKNEQDFKRKVEEIDFLNISMSDLIEIEKDLGNYIVFMSEEQIEDLSCSIFWGQDENTIKINSDKLKTLKKYKNGEGLSEEEKSHFLKSMPNAKSFEEGIAIYESAHKNLSCLIEQQKSAMENINATDASIDEIITNIIKIASENPEYKSIEEVLGCNIEILLKARTIQFIAEKEENITEKEKKFFIKSVPGAEDFEEAKRIYYIEKNKRPEIFNILEESEKQNSAIEVIENSFADFDDGDLEFDFSEYDTIDAEGIEVYFDSEYEKAEDPYIGKQGELNIESIEAETSHVAQFIEENSEIKESASQTDIVVRKKTFLEKMQESENPFFQAIGNRITAFMNRDKKTLGPAQNEQARQEGAPQNKSFNNPNVDRWGVSAREVLPNDRIGIRNSLNAVGEKLMNGIKNVGKIIKINNGKEAKVAGALPPVNPNSNVHNNMANGQVHHVEPKSNKKFQSFDERYHYDLSNSSNKTIIPVPPGTNKENSPRTSSTTKKDISER